MSTDGKKIKKFFYSYWFLALLFCIFFLLAGAFVKSFYQDYTIKKEIERLRKEAASMEAKKIQSLELLEYFKSNEFVERKAREDMGLIEPGEQAGVVNNLTKTKTGGQTAQNMVESDLPNYKKWWNYFFKHNLP